MAVRLSKGICHVIMFLIWQTPSVLCLAEGLFQLRSMKRAVKDGNICYNSVTKSIINTKYFQIAIAVKPNEI